MSQLYSPRYGDPSLKASTGRALEAGVNYKFTDKTIGMIKIFDRKTKDAFGYDAGKINPISGQAGSYANFGEENARGFDIQLKTSFAKHWKASAAYTYTYLETIPPKGNVTHNIRVPRSAWNLGIDYEKSKFTGGIHARAVIGKEGADRLGNKTAAAEAFHAYWVVDGMVNYRPNSEINIFAKCSNIFDRLYTDQSYELDLEKNWYSAPGRMFEIGMEYSF